MDNWLDLSTQLACTFHMLAASRTFRLIHYERQEANEILLGNLKLLYNIFGITYILSFVSWHRKRSDSDRIRRPLHRCIHILKVFRVARRKVRFQSMHNTQVAYNFSLCHLFAGLDSNSLALAVAFLSSNNQHFSFGA
jgi:hypothetical protein